MQNIIQEFQRLSGVAPSFLERAAADPMLGVLAKAFSVKTVKPADVKYLLYRKVGKGVELEDKASKFGDILTSVEPRDADPKTLVAFLKKHGAKPAPKVESIEEAKSSFDIEVIHAKSNPEVVKVDVTGSFRGDPIHGRSRQIHLGIETMRHGWVSLGDKFTINRPDSGKKVPDGFKTKILKAALAKLVPLAHKIGNKEFAESIEEGVAQTILKQMGGPGRLKSMLGAKHFIDHGKALSFQFPNRKRSKGNAVKITLRSDDTYDMEFSAISGGGTKVKKVKTYSGITFDQLQPLFTEWTGLYLSL